MYKGEGERGGDGEGEGCKMLRTEGTLEHVEFVCNKGREQRDAVVIESLGKSINIRGEGGPMIALNR